jgi:hypothetical protein
MQAVQLTLLILAEYATIIAAHMELSNLELDPDVCMYAFCVFKTSCVCKLYVSFDCTVLVPTHYVFGWRFGKQVNSTLLQQHLLTCR